MTNFGTKTALSLSVVGSLFLTAAARAESEPAAPAPPASAAVAEKDAASLAPAGKEYKSPYPDRVNFFEPSEGAVEQYLSAAKQTSSSGRGMSLKGFVSFTDEPVRAVLLVNDKIVQLAAGESAHGVKVISTAPPTAVVASDDQQFTMNLMKQQDPRLAGKSAPRNSQSLGNRTVAGEHTAGSRAEMRMGRP